MPCPAGFVEGVDNRKPSSVCARFLRLVARPQQVILSKNIKLAELTWPSVETLDREIVVVCPIAAMEQPSRHLHFFTDSILCKGVVAPLEAVLPNDTLLFPIQWLGASAHHLAMAGTLTTKVDTYLRLLCEPLRCLLPYQFRRVNSVTGHGGSIDGFHIWPTASSH